MNVIVLTKRAGTQASFRLRRGHIATVAVAIVALLGAALYGGVRIGEAQRGAMVLPVAWQEDLARSRDEVARLSEAARQDMDALAVRVAQLQAQAIRLNALGQRLVSIAQLDEGEFDFSQTPGQGGPQAVADAEMPGMEPPDFLRSLEQLSRDLDDREQRLRALETYFMTRKLEQTVLPAGRPVSGGWVSSTFGTRTDPFTGRREAHHGLDFAGREGAEIHTVAAGVVTWAGDRYGYGNMVEINHGNGYITRYAHNKENLVKAGDVVEKGQVIALLGSTGRSTGPHVHFEVLKNGRVVDPARYIRAAK